MRPASGICRLPQDQGERLLRCGTKPSPTYPCAPPRSSPWPPVPFSPGCLTSRAPSPRLWSRPASGAPAGHTLYCSRCLRPVRCMSLALRSLKLHSQSLHRKRITFPSSLHTWDGAQPSFPLARPEALDDAGPPGGAGRRCHPGQAALEAQVLPLTWFLPAPSPTSHDALLAAGHFLWSAWLLSNALDQVTATAAGPPSWRALRGQSAGCRDPVLLGRSGQAGTMEPALNGEGSA